jgi:hypothetical protein
MKWKFAEDRGDLDKVGFKDNNIEKFGQDPTNPKSQKKPFYSTNIWKELDKHYTKIKPKPIIL